MPRRGFAGGAVPTTLAGPLSLDGTQFTITKRQGWVFTTTPFVVVVDRGDEELEEKILCSAISVNVVSIATDGRGFDGTVPKDHPPGAAVHHVLSSDVVDEANLHVHDDERDDHPQYSRRDDPVVAATYRHVQAVPSAEWVIDHHLGFRPNLVVMDSAGNVVQGDITHLDSNQLTVTFAAAFSGEASLT